MDAQRFAYDGLRRLKEVWTPANANCSVAASAAGLGGPAPYWKAYAFDVAGNRTKEVSRSASGSTTTNTYTYAASGATAVQPHAVTSITSVNGSTTTTGSYTYDANGATATRTPAGGTAQTLTWDAEQRLTTVKQGTSTVGSYVYTAEGERLIRKQGGKTTVYLPGGQELTLTTSSGALAAQRYYAFAGQTVATRTGTAASTVSSLFADTQGTALVSVQNITDTVTVRRTDPYGNVRGTNPSWPGDHLFLDKVRDSTGLTQVGARYYDASIGRFVSVDPVLDLKDPAQWSAYSYGEHNPVTYSDPTGMLSWASFRSGLSKVGSAVKNGVSSAWKSTGSFVKKHQASIVGFAAGAIVTGGCLVATGGVGSVGCAALGGAAAGAASNLWRTQVQKTSRFTVGGFVRETVFGAAAGAIGGAAAKPLAAAASWAGRVVGPAAQRFGAGALSAARQAVSKVSQALAQTAQNIRTQVVQQARSAVQSVSRLLPSRSSGPAQTATSFCANSFTGVTLVLMADGTKKPIKDVELGDKVMATDPETGEQGPRTVIDLIRHGGAHTMVAVRLADGTTIDATDGHPFWVANRGARGEWVDAIDLREGDQLVAGDGARVEIAGIGVRVEDLRAFNLTVDDLHTYYVGENEILVHNASCANITESGLVHSFDRHAAQWFGGEPSKAGQMAEWRGIIERAAGSSKVVPWKSGTTLTHAHLARIDGKYFAAQFDRETGDLVTAFVPNSGQLGAMLRLLGH